MGLEVFELEGLYGEAFGFCVVKEIEGYAFFFGDADHPGDAATAAGVFEVFHFLHECEEDGISFYVNA